MRYGCRMNEFLVERPPQLAPGSGSAQRHWPARLELLFAEGAKRTRLLHCRHQGPLRVQRLFHPDEDGTAHCYLLHPPGGVVLGDELLVDAVVRSGRALLTTPSAGRFYGVGDFRETQEQRVRLSVNEGASLSWLPQETILFPGANARLDNDVSLAGTGASLVFWDVIVLGRPACGERFSRGRVEQRLRVRRGSQLVLDERLALAAGDRLSHSAMGLRGASTVGTFVLTLEPGADCEELCARWLEAVNGHGGVGEFSVTQRGDLLLARYLGEDAARCRTGFSRLWQAQRKAALGYAPSEPRIWHT
jgi:urease accessory protein